MMTAAVRSLEKTPFDSRVEVGPFAGEALVTGAFPEWLRGRLIRTAPAVFSKNGWSAKHWFDAVGMLYSFDIAEHGRVTWKQRVVECDVSRALDATGKIPFATFASGNDRSFLKRVFQPVPEFTDNANVNIVPMGGDWMAMTESPRHLVIDPSTLKTRRHVEYTDALPRGMWMTAHPMFDMARDRIVNVGSAPGSRPEVVVFEHARGGAQRDVVGRIKTPRLPYIHSFGLTAKKVVLVAHPMDVNPLSLVWSNDFAGHFRWKPEQGTRLVVVDRATGETEEWETDPLFVFHTVNTFHDGEDLVLDLLAYEDPSLMMTVLRMENIARGLVAEGAQLTRVRMTKGRKRATIERLCQERFELPQISYRAKSGERHRYVWGAHAGVAHTTGEPESSVLRVDTESGRVDRYTSDECVLGEPIFVSAPSPKSEDDGIVLVVATCPARAEAHLLALTPNLEPLARATIDVPLPLGFHGNFERSRL